MKVGLIFDPEAKTLVIKTPSGLEDSLFLTTLEVIIGFSASNANQYVLDLEKQSATEIFDIVRNIIDLFVSEKIEYTVDREAAKLIKKANDDLKKRQAVKSVAKKLLKIKTKSYDELVSTEFKRVLKKYQEESVHLMVKIPYAANFSVPGSGKTTMLYAAYSRLRAIGDVQKLFIIAPSAAYIAWSEEYEACFNKKPQIARITGPKYKRVRFYHNPEKHEIFITTYQTAAADVNELSDLLKSARFLLVLDESHNIKRFGSGVWSSAVRKLAVHATRRIILTGTPVPNSLLDLWGQFYFLDPEIAGTQAWFRGLTQKSGAEELLRERLMPYYRRIKKKDLDLPDPIYKLGIVRASKLQKRIYEAVKQATLEELSYTKSDKLFLNDLRKAVMIRLM